MFNRWLSCQLRTCSKSVVIAIAAALSTSNCSKSVIIAIATGLLTTICSKSVVIAIATGLLTTTCSKSVVIAIATGLSTSNCSKPVVVLMRASIVKPQQAERTLLRWGLMATIRMRPDDRLAASCANLAVYIYIYINLVPRAFPFCHWEGGKRPWHRAVT